MAKTNTMIPPQYIHFTNEVLDDKTIVHITIDKSGIPENTKKINASCLYTKSYTLSDTQETEEKEFIISQNNLPFVTEWEIPTTGPIELKVFKEVNQEETVPSTEVVNEVTFNSANANLVTIEGNEQNPPLVIIDDDGIRMKDAYVDRSVDLQMFANPNNGNPPTQGQPMEWDSQLIQTSCKFDFTGINLSDFEGLSVTGSYGPNNFVGLVIRVDGDYQGDFGDGLSYDFDNQRWVTGMSDYYNIASWPTQTRNDVEGARAIINFDTDFATSMRNYYTPVTPANYDDIANQGDNWVVAPYCLRAIPIEKVKDIPAEKWQELFDPNKTVNMSYMSNGSEVSWGHLQSIQDYDNINFTLDPSKAAICFLFAMADSNQPCRVTKFGIKKSSTSTSTSTKKVPALNPEDFTYDIKTEKGKSAVRFEWSGWQVDMTGNIYCKSLYFPISQ